MELRQLRYFVRTVELGAIGRAARDLGVVTSALSQQISRLESELATRLLQRTPTGVVPTDAGLAFWRQARLALRHVDDAMTTAQAARMAGSVSVGFARSTASLLAQPFYAAMCARYPNVRLHLVEGLSGHMVALLNARRLDLAVLFQLDGGHRWSALPLLDERLFLLARADMVDVPAGQSVTLAQVAHLPQAVTSRSHGLRRWVDAAFERAGLTANIAVEIDGLATLMDVVRANPIATIQPGAVIAHVRAGEPQAGALQVWPLADPLLFRRNIVTGIADTELSPPALVARVVLVDVMRTLAREGRWPGVTLLEL